MNVPIGLVNRGGIKTGFSLNEDITYGKACEVLGNNNLLMSVEIEGRLFHEMLRKTCLDGEFQVFGLSYRFNCDSSISSSKIDQELVEERAYDNPSVLIGDSPLDITKWYHIAMPEYCWSLMFNHMKDKYFARISQEDISKYCRNIIIGDITWQQLFTAYIERIKIITEETLELESVP
jgi:hypothetical protein